MVKATPEWPPRWLSAFQSLPAEQDPEVVVVRARLFPLPVEHLDMDRQDSDRERVERRTCCAFSVLLPDSITLPSATTPRRPEIQRPGFEVE